MVAPRLLMSNNTLLEYQKCIRNHTDNFINRMPKVEMHVHIEGTMTPELRWALAERHAESVPNPKTGKPCQDLMELKSLYELLHNPNHAGVEGGMVRFFELYYAGFTVLQDEEDFYRLAMNYFKRAATMNIRYCEPFFDPQGHTTRGISFDVIMTGFRRAQVEAAEKLNVKSQWIMCILRDMSPESAMSHYLAALPYRDVIVGIGLDSLERGRPPLLFDDVFRLARQDGFKITCHCDVGEKDTLQNISQVIHQVGGTGADRIDHGLHAVDDPGLLREIEDRDLGMTICPWGYLCYSGVVDVLQRVIILHSMGIKIAIGSDDPAYMEDIWLTHSLYLLREFCGFTDNDFLTLQRNAVAVCWASADLKSKIMAELCEFEQAMSH